jgi:benzoyl-CoA reductase/2-hydroxyglutaryl-CoA dehydratase subunit BcrC/BadD/HgdB
MLVQELHSTLMNLITYTSPFIPVEWIAAHRLQPFWLQPRAGSNRSALAVTRGICPFAGAVLDAAEVGIGAAALVLTTICDQMRYAAALAESGGHLPIFLMNVPSTWQTDESRQLYLEELRRLGRFLEKHSGRPPSGDELARVMLAYDRARFELQSTRAEFSAKQFARAMARLRGPLHDFCCVGSGAMPTLVVGMLEKPEKPQHAHDKRGHGTQTRSSGIPLAVLGGPLLEADDEFYDVLETAGGRVVLDATEGGERTMPKRFDPRKVAADPLQELADVYFDSLPDAFRRPNHRLYEWLGVELAARQVRGLVFRRYVWCDLWHAELKRLKDWSPVPVLELDVGDDDLSARSRMTGRLEAFLEMLATK